MNVNQGLKKLSTTQLASIIGPSSSARNERRRAKRILRTLPDPRGLVLARIAYTEPLTKLEREIVPELESKRAELRFPRSWGRPGLCHHNCREFVEAFPEYKVVLGWLRLYDNRSPFPTSYQHHSVVEAPDGELIEITPQPITLLGIEFIRDEKLESTWETRPSGAERITLTRIGRRVPEHGLRTPAGIMSLPETFKFTLGLPSRIEGLTASA